MPWIMRTSVSHRKITLHGKYKKDMKGKRHTGSWNFEVTFSYRISIPFAYVTSILVFLYFLRELNPNSPDRQKLNREIE